MAAVYQFHHHPYAFGVFAMDDMEDGPFFGHHGHHGHHGHPHGGHPPPPPFWDHFHGHWQSQGPDHPDIPGEANDASSSSNEGTPTPPAGPGDHAGEQSPEGCRRGSHRGRGRGHHRGGPRAFHGHGHGHPPFPPFHAGFARGRGGFPGHRGALHGHGHHFGHRGRPFHAPPPFMRHFAGMDMNQIPDHWPRHGNEDIDFIPRADLFDTTNSFIVHVSLPGARKSDLSVEYDASHATLRLRGVVHRPGMTEEMHRGLVFDERAFETGVFERKIRLGHPRKPAHIDSDRISTSLTDGVLIVTLPKLSVGPEPEYQNEKIPVEVADEKPNSAGEDATTTENSPPTAKLDAMTVDSETVEGEQEDEMHTPGESEISDLEGEGHEYVKVDV